MNFFFRQKPQINLRGDSPAAYDAFISYRHDHRQALIARALHRALHSFAKPWHRLRALRLYRDETNLSANPDLWLTIQKALNQSTHLLLIACPQSANSEGVQREVSYWLETKDASSIIIILTDGDLYWHNEDKSFDVNKTTCLPPAVMTAFKVEPLWVDLTWVTQRSEDLSITNLRMRDVVASLASALHGIDKDRLISEDLKQRRRMLFLAYFSIATITVLAVLSTIAAVGFFNQRNTALLQESRSLATISSNILDQGDPQAAILVALEGLPSPYGYGKKRPYSTEAASAVASAYYNNHQIALLPHNSSVITADFLGNPTNIITSSSDGFVHFWEIGTSQLPIKSIKAHEKNIISAQISTDGKRYVTSSSDGEVKLWGLSNNELRLLHTLKHADPATEVFLAGDDHYAVITITKKNEEIEPSDDNKTFQFNSYIWETSKPIPDYKYITSSDNQISFFFSPSRKLLALGTSNFTEDQDENSKNDDLIVMDVAKNKNSIIAQRKVHSGYISNAAFDQSETLFFVIDDNEMATTYKLNTNLSPLDTFEMDHSTAVTFDPSGKNILIAELEGNIKIRYKGDNGYDFDTLYKIPSNSHVESLSFSKSTAQKLLAVFNSTLTLVWSENIGNIYSDTKPIKINTIFPSSAGKINPNGNTFLTTSDDNFVRVWSFAETAISTQYLEHNFSPKEEDHITPMDFTTSSGGNYILAKEIDSKDRLHIWSTKTGKILYVVPPPESKTKYYISNTSTAINEGITTIAIDYRAFGGESLVKIVTIDKNETIQSYFLPGNNSLSDQRNISIDGTKLVTYRLVETPNLEKSHELSVWNLSSPQNPSLQTFPNLGAGLSSISKDGLSLFVEISNQSNSGCVWRLPPPSPTCAPINDLGDDLRVVAISSDARFLAVGDEQGTTKLYDISSSPIFMAQVSLPTGPITDIKFPPNSNVILLNNNMDYNENIDNTYIWHYTDPNKNLEPIYNSRGGISAVGGTNFIVTGTSQGTEILWDTSKPQSTSISLPKDMDVPFIGFLEDESSLLYGSPMETPPTVPFVLKKIKLLDDESNLTLLAKKQLVRCLTIRERIHFGLSTSSASPDAAAPTRNNDYTCTN